MGQHKFNPTAIAAKNEELAPKKNQKLSKRQRESLIREKIEEKTGLSGFFKYVGRYM